MADTFVEQIGRVFFGRVDPAELVYLVEHPALHTAAARAVEVFIETERRRTQQQDQEQDHPPLRRDPAKIGTHNVG